jgi:hypothetical protein
VNASQILTSSTREEDEKNRKQGRKEEERCLIVLTDRLLLPRMIVLEASVLGEGYLVALDVHLTVNGRGCCAMK